MTPLGVRGCPGVVSSALHLLLNRTPPDEVFQALATESGPILNFRQPIAGFERARIRDVALATGVYKEFCHFPSPNRAIRRHGASDGSARIRVAYAKRGPYRDPAVPCDTGGIPLTVANGAPRARRRYWELRQVPAVPGLLSRTPGQTGDASIPLDVCRK